jgi:hypothetical protein
LFFNCTTATAVMKEQYLAEMAQFATYKASPSKANAKGTGRSAVAALVDAMKPEAAPQQQWCALLS